jgi:DNA-directed RNA polymerase subunit RPC12/RpoP
VGDTILRCATCGREFDGDPDENPTGDAGRPICGECARENDFLTMDMLDGELDGNMDPDR